MISQYTSSKTEKPARLFCLLVSSSFYPFYCLDRILIPADTIKIIIKPILVWLIILFLLLEKNHFRTLILSISVYAYILCKFFKKRIKDFVLGVLVGFCSSRPGRYFSIYTIYLTMFHREIMSVFDFCCMIANVLLPYKELHFSVVPPNCLSCQALSRK